MLYPRFSHILLSFRNLLRFTHFSNVLCKGQEFNISALLAAFFIFSRMSSIHIRSRFYFSYAIRGNLRFVGAKKKCSNLYDDEKEELN